MKHDMDKVTRFAFERWWKKQQVMKRDNMKGVPMTDQFMREVWAVMSEIHAAAILKHFWKQEFQVQSLQGGGRPDFRRPDGLAPEIKVSDKFDGVINLNKNGSKKADFFVKFYVNFNEGTTTYEGYSTREEYLADAEYHTRPKGRSYWSNKVKHKDFKWAK